MLLSDIATVRAASIVLASGSPRRVDMFNNLLKLNARVVPSTFPEDLDKSLFTPVTYVMENAKQKALEVHSRLTSQGEEPPLVVGADTVVVRSCAYNCVYQTLHGMYERLQPGVLEAQPHRPRCSMVSSSRSRRATRPRCKC